MRSIEAMILKSCRLFRPDHARSIDAMIPNSCRPFGRDRARNQSGIVGIFLPRHVQSIWHILVVRPKQMVPICLDKSPHSFNQ